MRNFIETNLMPLITFMLYICVCLLNEYDSTTITAMLSDWELFNMYVDACLQYLELREKGWRWWL